MDWIWDELKYKAKIMKETGMVTAYNPGIVRSDTAISKELQEALQKAVQKLEQVPEKDYHPGSNDTVVDLVHPSLFPVVYGRICVLPDELLHRDHWWAWSGKAEVLATPSELETTKKVYHGSLRHSQFKLYSTKFQWLPCDVDFVGNGESRIFSYINNLHPQKHQDLYRIIERIIDEAIPLWDESLHEAQSRPADRIEYRHVEYFTAEPEPERSEDDHDEIEFFSRHDEWEDRRRVRQPESEGKFKPLDRQGYREPHSVRLREQFRESGLQIIVKLANIELTPERPRY